VSKRFDVQGLDPKASLGENARAILKARIAEYYHYTPIVHDEQSGVLLHELRIAAKRLRYTLEMFRDVLGDEGERQIERVKAIQDVLGELHDCDVRIEMIEEELVDLTGWQMRELSGKLKQEPLARHRAITSSALRPPPDDPRRGLLALLSRQHIARHEHYEQFVTLWDQYAVEGMRANLVALSQTPRWSRLTISSN
jgi:CHAD domain-containing protein